MGGGGYKAANAIFLMGFYQIIISSNFYSDKVSFFKGFVLISYWTYNEVYNKELYNINEIGHKRFKSFFYPLLIDGYYLLMPVCILYSKYLP